MFNCILKILFSNKIYMCMFIFYDSNKIVLARGRGRGQNQRGKGTGSAPWLNQQNQPGGSQTGRGRG